MTGSVHEKKSVSAGEEALEIARNERLQARTELAAKQVTWISAGAQHTACVTRGGKVFTWGENEHGQLGHGHHNDVYLPTEVTASIIANKRVRSVASGGQHTLCISDTGWVFAWGRGTEGQLGTNMANQSCAKPFEITTFISPQGTRTATDVFAGDAHSAAIISGAERERVVGRTHHHRRD